MSERILRQDAGGLCTLTLNRPDKLNALDTDSFEALQAHIAAIETDEAIGCVVLRGVGRAFCAGADLGGFGNWGASSAFKPGVIARLANLRQPVIGAIHGVCFTGGLELALACDLIVADASARFADTHGKWGLVGQWGITQRLPRRIGTANAMRMMLTASVVEAEEAHRIGLVDVLAPAGGLDGAVDGLARQILENSWFSNTANKRLVRDTDGMSLEDGLAHERDRHPGFAPDHMERIERFSRKK